MRKVLCKNLLLAKVIVLLVGTGVYSCAPRQEDAATAAFNKWVSYIMSGNIEGALKLSSRLMKARWLYRVYEQIPFSPFASERYREMPEELIGIFDSWITAANAQFISAKTLPVLPEKLADSEWFLETIKQHYEQGRELILREFRDIKVLERAVSYNQASLVVRTAENVTELYILRLEGETWKVDWNKPAYGTD